MQRINNKEQPLLTDVNFTVPGGKMYAIVGPSGSGKSTLVQHLNGLIAPTRGQVLFDGQDIFSSKETTRAVRFKVGLVFQYPEYQLFEESVEKDIAFGPKNMGLSEDEINKRVLEAARITGLSEEYLDKSPFELSGGEKRRVAIAGVLAMEPEVLILDEPTAGLDPKGRESILSEIKAYHDRSGATVILVSHSMEDVARFASHVLIMDHGKAAIYGKTREVFKRVEELVSLGLEVPQISRVFAMLREKGMAVPESVLTVPEAKTAVIKLLEKGGNGDA